MSGTLIISEEKFSKDDLGRNVTTLTQMYYGSINSEIADEVEQVIAHADETGEVEYCNYEGMTFEVYGTVVNNILSELGKATNSSIVIVGGIDEKQLYEVSMSF